MGEMKLSDAALAGAIADYYIDFIANQRKWHFLIMHDMRVAGPCPVEFDWQHKNIVGIDTNDRARARDWAVRAMLAGYAVFHSGWSRGRSGYSQGTLRENNFYEVAGG
jgi:hypothetical protein